MTTSTLTPSTTISESELCHSGILYADLPLLRSCLAGTAAGESLSMLPPVNTIASLSHCLGNLQTWCNKSLQEAALRIVPWSITKPDDLLALRIGDLRSFQFAVRTRGVGYWGIADSRSGEIYRKFAGITVRIIVESAWVTGDHSHSLLTSGNTTLCGIFSVRDIDTDKNVIIGVPIILGAPVSDFCRAVSPDFVHLMSRTETAARRPDRTGA